MGVSTWLGLGKSTDRILKRYGVRSGVIINGTGTGTQLVLSLMDEKDLATTAQFVFGEDNQLIIKDFAPIGQPIRPHRANIGGVKRTLSGGFVTFGKLPTIDIDVTVIGNSVDYYRLSWLSTFCLHRNERTRLKMSFVSNSAPGANLELLDGVITDADPLMGVEGNSRISDKTFTFSFSDIGNSASLSAQHYDPTTTPNLFEEITGIEIR